MINCVLLETVYGATLKKRMTLAQAVELLRENNLVNNGQLTELAISKRSGVSLCKPMTANIDTVTGKQIKYATVTKGENSKYYKAYISRNTTAPILCVITNPAENGKQYFLNIPYSAHSHLSGACLAISFGTKGTESVSYLWNYQVSSFDLLCEQAK